MGRVWLCEKPSQAADLAKELGGAQRRDGYYETARGVVTYALGHLLEDAEPSAYGAQYAGPWSFSALPILPDSLVAKPSARGRAQLGVIKQLLAKADEVVLATDPDREGELIGREILDHCRYSRGVKRLWTSSLDKASFEKALASLKDGASTLPLAWAARGRGHADWLVGMNCSRAATLAAKSRGADHLFAIGRVQTPTLALVVRRDREIENFTSREFYELAAQVATADGSKLTLRHAPASSPEDLRLFDRAQAQERAARATGAQGPLKVVVKRRKSGPPKLFSLSGLQKACNKRFGWSADKTLEIAQSLYEDHKSTSYPRSDCTFLPEELIEQIPAVLQALRAVEDLGKHVDAVDAQPTIRKSVFDTSKVTAHYAITPTPQAVNWSALSEDQRKAYRLIGQYYLAALMPDYEFDETRIAMDANGVLFTAVGRVPAVLGWRAVFGAELDEDDEEGAAALPTVADGTSATVRTVDIEALHTQPPKPYTEGTLIEDMTSIAKFATDPAVKARLRETSGIGTEATRASIIKSLRTRKYIAAAERGKAIVSTPLGRALVDLVPAELTDAALTAVWEDQLDDIANGKVAAHARDTFVGSVREQVRRIVEEFRAMGEAGAGAAQAASLPPRAPTDNMLKFAKSIAKQMGLKKLPAAVATDGDACRKWLDEHAKSVTDAPSPKAVDFARAIAARLGIALPPDALTQRAANKAFLDKYATYKHG